MHQVLALASTQVYHYSVLTRHSISQKAIQKKAWNIFWQYPQCSGTRNGEVPVTAVKCQHAQAKTDVNKIEGIYIRFPSVTAVTL